MPKNPLNKHSQSRLVMKFGGTSVANIDAIHQVVQIIQRSLDQNPIVVTSALANITNLLVETLEKSNGSKKSVVQDFSASLNEIEKRHRHVLKHFRPEIQKKIEPELQTLFSELLSHLKSLHSRKFKKNRTQNASQMQDEIASFGERLSSWLLTGALWEAGISAQRIDSRDLILTDSHFGSAEIDFAQTKSNIRKTIKPLVKRDIVPVITGFIGRDRKGNTTTLGRGGSDYSAAIVALCLDAREIQIWKDIPGFMTADPRVVKNAKVIAELSFQEAAELSYFGAKLLHPKTIHPAIQKNIPVRILNTFEPDDPGTLILGKPKPQNNGNGHATLPVQAISYKKGITVINVTSLRMLGPYGFLEELFRIFSHHKVPIDVVATSEVSVSMTIEDAALNPGLLKDLKTIGTVDVKKSHAILSLVGYGLKEDPRVEEKIFTILRKEKIQTEMISKGASSINFTCTIEQKNVVKAVQNLHDSFF